MNCLFNLLMVVAALISSVAATPSGRFSRQIIFPDDTPRPGQGQGQFGNKVRDPTLVRGVFTGFGEFQPGQDFVGTGNGGITIPANGGTQVFRPANPPPPIGVGQPGNGLNVAGNGGLVNGVLVPGLGQNSNSISGSTPAPPPTTRSPAYYNCMSRCPATNEYNPVCGTDGINYHNSQRLSCAQNCGINVSLVRMGTCLPL